MMFVRENLIASESTSLPRYAQRTPAGFIMGTSPFGSRHHNDGGGITYGCVVSRLLLENTQVRVI